MFVYGQQNVVVFYKLRKLLSVLVERLCDRNQEQKRNLPVG